MVLLCGIPSEPPVARVSEQLGRLGAKCVMFNQRQFARTELAFEVSGSQVTGRLRLPSVEYRLEDFQGVYIRLMDDQLLPELRKEPVASAVRRYCRALHDTLMHWCEISPARVVNRFAPMGSNFSKPYQAQLLRERGFQVPETLITNDPELVREFRSRHQKVIYKSISGVRSIVQTFEDEDLARLHRISWCPVQFQEFIEGTNVRVHIVGTEVYATEIITDSIDYRYAHRNGNVAELRTIELSHEVREKCVRLCQALGLVFAGVDLKITPDNRIFCFEANPCPAFSYYESQTAQPIAQAVARYLIGKQ